MEREVLRPAVVVRLSSGDKGRSETRRGYRVGGGPVESRGSGLRKDSETDGFYLSPSSPSGAGVGVLGVRW